jgi:hypothetical protein
VGASKFGLVNKPTWLQYLIPMEEEDEEEKEEEEVSLM